MEKREKVVMGIEVVLTNEGVSVQAYAKGAMKEICEKLDMDMDKYVEKMKECANFTNEKVGRELVKEIEDKIIEREGK